MYVLADRMDLWQTDYFSFSARNPDGTGVSMCVQCNVCAKCLQCVQCVRAACDRMTEEPLLCMFILFVRREMAAHHEDAGRGACDGADHPHIQDEAVEATQKVDRPSRYTSFLLAGMRSGTHTHTPQTHKHALHTHSLCSVVIRGQSVLRFGCGYVEV